MNKHITYNLKKTTLVQLKDFLIFGYPINVNEKYAITTSSYNHFRMLYIQS